MTSKPMDRDLVGELSRRTVLVLLALALVGLVFIARGHAPFITSYFMIRQDVPAVIVFAAFALLMGRALALPRVASRLNAMMDACERWPVWAIAAFVAVVSLAGVWLVFGHYPLSMDEFWARADGPILATGKPMARIPAEWREYAPALQPIFTRILPEGWWASEYLPVNAAIQQLLGPFASPALAAVSVVLAADLARQLMPEHRSAPVVCALLMASSSQLLITAMTPYAMSAHLAANLAWLWLFLRRRGWAHVAAGAIAFLAVGLHQVVFFPLFALPFLFEAFIADRRPAAVLHGAVIAGGFLFWSEWDKVIYWWLQATPPTGLGPTGTALLFDRFVALVSGFGLDSLGLMALNLIRWTTWQNVLAVPLLLAIPVAAVRSGGVWRALVAGIVLTALTMTVVLAFQGHGWGYRYLHGLLGNLCLLATYAWFRLTEEDSHGRPLRALLAAAVALSLVLFPVRGWQAQRFVAPYRNADAAISSTDADVVLVNAPHHIYSIDLVRNDIFLTNRPKRMAPILLTDAQLVEICLRYRVSVFTDADARRFGLPLPKGGAYPSKALPRPCQALTRDGPGLGEPRSKPG